MLEETDFSLRVLMSIFMFEEFRIDRMSKEFVGNNIFTNSLIGTLYKMVVREKEISTDHHI